MSDWNSFGEMVAHGYATDNKDVALKAFQAGSMMDMETKAMVAYIPQLLKEGKITMQQLDDAVGRILYYKFKLGLFDDPYKFSS
ncbi:glycoside hydrolase family 3 N-terminal domain-containing protein, partial [Acinetobacter baumannii]